MHTPLLSQVPKKLTFFRSTFNTMGLSLSFAIANVITVKFCRENRWSEFLTWLVGKEEEGVSEFSFLIDR